MDDDPATRRRMHWLRTIFSRPTATPDTVSTGYGDTLRKLRAAESGDERARLLDLLAVQLEGAFSGSANNVQVALWQVEERIRDRQGETNDLISEAVSLIRGQGAAVDALRADFQQVAETVSDLQLWRGDVDAELASFRRSREQSLADRRELKQRDDEAKHEREELRKQGQETAETVERIAGELRDFIARIEALIAQGPTPDEATRYRALMDQLMREREGGSG